MASSRAPPPPSCPAPQLEGLHQVTRARETTKTGKDGLFNPPPQVLFRVVREETGARRLVALRDLQEGELVFTEAPIATGARGGLTFPGAGGG